MQLILKVTKKIEGELKTLAKDILKANQRLEALEKVTGKAALMSILDNVDLEITDKRPAENIIKDFDEWKKNSEFKFVELTIENDESTIEKKLYFENNVYGNSRVSEIDQRFFK